MDNTEGHHDKCWLQDLARQTAKKIKGAKKTATSPITSPVPRLFSSVMRGALAPVALCALAVAYMAGKHGMHAQRRQKRVLGAVKIEDALAENSLSSEERVKFETEGYLVLPSALNATEISRLSDALDAWVEATTGSVAEGTTWHGMMFSHKHDIPLRFPEVVRLLVHPRVLGQPPSRSQ